VCGPGLRPDAAKEIPPPSGSRCGLRLSFLCGTSFAPAFCVRWTPRRSPPPNFDVLGTSALSRHGISARVRNEAPCGQATAASGESRPGPPGGTAERRRKERRQESVRASLNAGLARRTPSEEHPHVHVFSQLFQCSTCMAALIRRSQWRHQPVIRITLNLERAQAGGGMREMQKNQSRNPAEPALSAHWHGSGTGYPEVVHPRPQYSHFRISQRIRRES
jgi:hypothetical protein